MGYLHLHRFLYHNVPAVTVAGFPGVCLPGAAASALDPGLVRLTVVVALVEIGLQKLYPVPTATSLLYPSFAIH